MYNYLEVRRFTDDKPVKRFDVTGKSAHNIVRLDEGVNINLNHDEYYTDAAEYATEQELAPAIR